MQKTEAKKAWMTLENGKRHYKRATIIDITMAIAIPIIGPILGIAALTKKEYKRGFTMIAVSCITIAIIIIGTL